MKLSINCLHANTALVKSIESLMDIYAAELIAENGKAPIKTIYGLLEKDGVDIDRESLASLYQGKFDLTQDHYTSLDEIHEWSGEHFDKAINAINDAVDKTVTQKMGPRSAGKTWADKVAKMFSSTLAETHKVKTQVRVMGDILGKAVRANLEKKGVTTKPKATLEELVQTAVENLSQGFETLTGGFNSMDDLVGEFKAEMQKYTDAIEDPDTKALWETYTDKVVNSMYSAFISTSEADTIIREALFKKGFGKEVARPSGTKHTVLDWDKLSANIKSDAAMEHNIKDAIKDLVSPEHADRIVQVLQDRVKVLRDKQVNHQAKELDRRNTFKTHTAPTELGSLLRLYNYGAFNMGHGSKYYRLLSRAMGVPVDETTHLEDVIELTETANILFQNFGDIPEVHQKMSEAISKVVWKLRRSKSNWVKVSSAFEFWMNTVSMSLLGSATNMLQNPLGNQTAIWNRGIARLKTGERLVDPDEISRRSWAIFRDAATGGGPYGAASNRFYSRNALDSYLLSKDVVKRNQGLQIAISIALSTWNLAGMDSRSKYVIFAQELEYNVKKMMMDGGMSEEEAKENIRKAFYGERFKEAEAQAQQIIDSSNGVFKNNKNTVTRIADSIVQLNIVKDGWMTDKQFKQLRDAAYENAGFEIGHKEDPWNVIGLAPMAIKHTLGERVDRQLKEGNYPGAAASIIIDSVLNSFIYRFLAGSSNWTVLAVKRSGAGALAAIRPNERKARNVDFAKISEQELKTAAMNHHMFKTDMGNGIIGGAATLLTVLALLAAGETYRDWLKKNKWARKYTYAVLPMAAAVMTEAKDDKLTEYLMHTFFLDDRNDFTVRMGKAFMGKGWNGYPISHDEAVAAGVQAVGDQVLQFPFGAWRTVRDIHDAYNGIMYGAEKEFQENPTHVAEAMLWGGVVYETGGVDYLKSKGMWPETVGSLSGIGDKTEDLLEPYLKGMNDGEKLMYLKNQIELQIAEHDWNEAHPHTPYQGKKTELKKESEAGNMVNIFSTDDAKNALNDINDVKEVVEKEIKKEVKKKVQQVEIPVKYD